ncbi:MAG: aldehyde dehydrogenase family protein [Xanthomonadales bacterium]|nr:aldehyde dehydrogenase family protein [Xanthomonadales bacterium]
MSSNAAIEATSAPVINREAVRASFDAQVARAGATRGDGAKTRLQRLERLEAAILSSVDALHDACAADFRKPKTEIELSEIAPVIGELRFARKNLKRWMKPRRVRPTLMMLGNRGEIRYEPKGVALVISPWNYAFNLSMGPLVSAVAAGNSVMLKPSEFTPNVAEYISGLVGSVFDDSEVAVIEGGIEASQVLLDLPFDHVFFTGSPQVGRIVAAAASRHLASITLELGGKSPTIIDRTADVTKAARRIAWGKFINNGQTCIAPDHAYVDDAVFGDFVSEFQKCIDEFYGQSIDARASSRHYCRIVNRKHFQRLSSLVDEAVNAGARRLTLDRRDEDELFMAPTLLENIPRDCGLMQEEIFGPVLPLIRFTDLADVVTDVNTRPKPLALYIYSKNRETTARLLREIPSGDAVVNHNLIHFLHKRLPFGGIGNSGIGKSHGYHGFLAFSHERSVVTNHVGLVDRLFPPYAPAVERMALWARRFFA